MPVGLMRVRLVEMRKKFGVAKFLYGFGQYVKMERGPRHLPSVRR